MSAESAMMNAIFNEFKQTGGCGCAFSWKPIDQAISQHQSIEQIFLCFLREFRVAGETGPAFSWKRKIDVEIAQRKPIKQIMRTFMEEFKASGNGGNPAFNSNRVFAVLNQYS